MKDILVELDEACCVARTRRELERLCGNAAAEIRRLEELWSACTVRALAAENRLLEHGIPVPPLEGEEGAG